MYIITYLLLGVGGKVLLHEHLKGLCGYPTGQGVAAESAAVLAGFQGHHHRVVRQHSGDGHGASGQSLAY